MTNDEYLAIKNGARAVAAEIVAEWLAKGMSEVLDTLPAAARSDLLRSTRAKLEAKKAEYLKIAIGGRNPAESDLIAGEFQDAFEKTTNDMLKWLGEQR